MREVPSRAQDRNPATAGQNLDGEGCTRLQGAALSEMRRGLQEDKVAPVRLWEAVTAKKKKK